MNPVFTVAPDPGAPGEAPLRDVLILALRDAAQYRGAQVGRGGCISHCTQHMLCDFCRSDRAEAARYDRLADLLQDTGSDAETVIALLDLDFTALEWRAAA